MPRPFSRNAAPAPGSRRRSLLAGTAVATVSFLLSGCATPADDEPWPARTVPIEALRPLAPIRVAVPLDRAERGEPVASGSAAMRVHVAADGAVQRVALLQGSGNSTLDAAAIRAMRTARFRPYEVDGVAVPVTAIAPMHFFRRRHSSPDSAPRFGF